ncbi:MAG TPA: hypothetical protein DEB09_05450 [Candidatus Magasanikbacteria bacterium]|nr:hypothetical protein [Candidatus Magasanikbacteria bacterium]
MFHLLTIIWPHGGQGHVGDEVVARHFGARLMQRAHAGHPSFAVYGLRRGSTSHEGVEDGGQGKSEERGAGRHHDDLLSCRMCLLASKTRR